MTNSMRHQPKLSLSVRTRSLTLKAQERNANRRVLAKHNRKLGLRRRLCSTECTDVRGNQQDTVNGGSSSNCSSEVTTGASANGIKSRQNSPISADSPGNSEILLIRSSVGKNRNNVLPTGQHPDGCTQNSSSASESSESNFISACSWDGCIESVDQSQLINHIQHAHVLPQLLSNRRRYFFCLWRGCRVFKQPSVSAAWLEQHILHHTDAKGKPFRCIFDACNLRFSTSILLERHVRRTHMRQTRARLSHSTALVSDVQASTSGDAPGESPARPGPHTTTPIRSSRKSSARKRKRNRLYRGTVCVCMYVCVGMYVCACV